MTAMMGLSFDTISPIEFLIAALGIGHLGIGLSQKWRAADSQKWLATDGVVLKCKTWQRDTDNDSFHVCEVQYEYAVAGKTYLSGQVQFGKGDYLDREAASSLAIRYRAGASVTVYYDPRRPQKAALDRRAPRAKDRIRLGVIILGLLVAVDIAMAFYNFS